MGSTSQLYDTIGPGYAAARRPDQRILQQVLDALGDAHSVINVGAGTGNYEPTDRPVLAVEPSLAMLRQRSTDVPVVQAFAEALPVPDASFDASLAMFTIHHWTDREAGLAELRRVARRQVSLIYDTTVSASFWMLEYFPELRTAPWEENAPSAEWMGLHLDLQESRPLLVPADCTDGFSGAYWNRPEQYCDPAVQAGMSTLARLPEDTLRAGTGRLQAALDSGAWDAAHGHLRDQEWFDIGYRLAICGT